MYYNITSKNSQEVRLDLESRYLNIGKHVFAFVFDNSKGAIKLIQDASEQSVAWIPYDQVDYFDVVSKTSSGSTNKRYYHVVMYLKSFGSWPLFQTGFENKAAALLNELKASIDLTKPTSFIDKPRFASEVITATHERDKTILKWRNSAKGSDAVKLAAIGLLVGAVIFYLLKLTWSESVFGFLIMLVFVVVYVIIMYSQITMLMKDRVTSYGFAFSPAEVEYFEDSASSSTRKHSSVTPRARWHGLSYPNTLVTPDTIISMNGDSVKNYAQLVKDKAGLKQLFKASKETKSSPRLRIKDLHPVELVNLMNWIMREVDIH